MFQNEPPQWVSQLHWAFPQFVLYSLVQALSCSISSLQRKDIESLQNRLLKVCYVPASAPVLIGFFSFFALAINSTNEANKAGGTRH